MSKYVTRTMQALYSSGPEEALPNPSAKEVALPESKDSIQKRTSKELCHKHNRDNGVDRVS